jgi:hypothetical protein
MAQEDSENSKDILDFRPVSDDGNTSKLKLSISFYDFEKSQ